MRIITLNSIVKVIDINEHFDIDTLARVVGFDSSGVVLSHGLITGHVCRDVVEIFVANPDYYGYGSEVYIHDELVFITAYHKGKYTVVHKDGSYSLMERR